MKKKKEQKTPNIIRKKNEKGAKEKTDNGSWELKRMREGERGKPWGKEKRRNKRRKRRKRGVDSLLFT